MMRLGWLQPDIPVAAFVEVDGSWIRFFWVKPKAELKLGDVVYLELPEVGRVLERGDVVGILLPDFMEFEVVSAEAHIRGQQAAGGGKPAKLETGAVVTVPPFVETGTRIKVDTRTGTYVSRV